MAWTPIAAPSTNWQGKPEGVFSPLIFSHAVFGSKHEFADGTSALVWTAATVPASSWSPAA